MSLPYSVGKHCLIRLDNLGIKILEQVKVKKITDKSVVCEKEGGEITVPADTVVYTSNAIANTKLAKALEGKGLQVYKVGDCVEPRGVIEATREGYKVGLEI